MVWVGEDKIFMVSSLDFGVVIVWIRGMTRIYETRHPLRATVPGDLPRNLSLSSCGGSPWECWLECYCSFEYGGLYWEVWLIAIVIWESFESNLRVKVIKATTEPITQLSSCITDPIHGRLLIWDLVSTLSVSPWGVHKNAILYTLPLTLMP